MKKVGIFRVTSSVSQIRRLELNMNLGNYRYLDEMTDGFLVANYLKKMLQELKEPLVPFS